VWFRQCAPAALTIPQLSDDREDEAPVGADGERRANGALRHELGALGRVVPSAGDIMTTAAPLCG
jgi:hypothetical protein